MSLSFQTVIVMLLISLVSLGGGAGMLAFGTVKFLKEQGTYNGRAPITSFRVTSQYVDQNRVLCCLYTYKFSTDLAGTPNATRSAVLVSGYSNSHPCAEYDVYLLAQVVAHTMVVPELRGELHSPERSALHPRLGADFPGGNLRRERLRPDRHPRQVRV